jgi:mannitol operon transcriptional antiterminator
MLALLLLDASDALKTFALTREMDMSTAAVRRDLDVLRPWFGLYGLELTSRKGLGVRLEGAESSRRQALCSIIMEHYGEAGFLDLIRDEAGEAARGQPVAVRQNGDDPNSLVLRLFPPEPFREAERVLSGLPKGSLPALAPRDYLGLVIHLGVASLRLRSGHRLEAVVSGGGDERSRSAAEFDTATVARAVIDGMSDIGALPDDAAELGGVQRFLRGAKPERTMDGATDSEIGSIAEALSLIEDCGRALECSFAGDRLLRDGLAAHWGPALYRVRNRFPIRNPMLGQIMSEYSMLFGVIRAACARVFPGLYIPDDEIGYLVLHFGSAIARRGAGGERFRALVICSAGIGSARMLSSRIQTELPEVEIVANLSWFDVKAVSRDSWDILVSTIPLPLDESEYVLVDPLLSAKGLAAVRRHLAERRSRMIATGRSTSESRGDGTLEELRLRGRQLQAVIGVLERITVYPEASCGDDWDGFLSAAVERCALSGLVNDKAVALDDLRERSRDFGILLPSSRVLFLHARSEGVSVSSLSLHAFPGEVPAPAACWETAPTRLALMLAPRSLDRETQDILSEISVSLLDAKTVEILQAADETSIKYHYSRYLDRYFRSTPAQGA